MYKKQVSWEIGFCDIMSASCVNHGILIHININIDNTHIPIQNEVKSTWVVISLAQAVQGLLQFKPKWPSCYE